MLQKGGNGRHLGIHLQTGGRDQQITGQQVRSWQKRNKKEGGLGMMKRILFVLVVVLAFVAAIPVQAADFPEKEVQIIIPWAPGGATDLIFRAPVSYTHLTLP